MSEKRYDYIDLFAGIAGFAYGAYRAGIKFRNHYFSEVEPYTVELYQKRFPGAIPLGDITKINTGDLKDSVGSCIITGGFPCQDISIAGKGEGIHGERSGLWFEYWRLIRDLLPRYAIIENVGALVGWFDCDRRPSPPKNHNEGDEWSVEVEQYQGVAEVTRNLAKIGYNAEWQDIRAEDMGAPHKRERIWIVAYPGRSTEGSPLNGFSGKHQHGTPAQLRAKEGDRLADKSESCSACKQSEDAKLNKNKPYLKCPECGLRCYEIPNSNSTRPPGSGRTNATVKDSDREKNGIFKHDCESNGEFPDSSRGMLHGFREKGRGRGESADGIIKREISDTNGQHDDNTGHGASEICGERSETSGISGSLADNYNKRCEEQHNGESEGPENIDRQDAGRKTKGSGWPVEPTVGMLVNGLPDGMDRFEGRLALEPYRRVAQLKGLGNAVLPDIPEILFRLIKENL